jgi:hypothetical protein
LIVTYIGYQRSAKAIFKDSVLQTIDFRLSPSFLLLSEVQIRPGENPAWAIVRKVIANKSKNNRQQLSSYQYSSYARTELDVSHLSERLQKNPVTRKASRALNASRKIEGDSGKMVLPVFVSESVSDFYCNNLISKTKEVIHKTKVTGVGVADNSILNQLLGQSFLTLNFYNNNISIVSKDFISPLTDSWRLSYHYYLTDSLDLSGHFCYVLVFKPKNDRDLAFSGTMWIDKNTSALVQIHATVAKEANINYVDKIKIQQEFIPTVADAWLPLNTRVLVEVNNQSTKTAGLLARTYVHNSNVVINQALPAAFFETPVETAENTVADETFWQSARPQPLTNTESQVYQMIDSVKNIPAIKGWISTIDFVVGGYKTFGKIELGPYLYMYAYNRFEGNRFRLGFRTDEAFSKVYNLKGYVALSTKDPKPFKFNLDGSRILSRKRFTEVGIRGGFEAEQLGISTEEVTFNTNLATALFSAFTRFGQFDRPYYTSSVDIYLNTEVRPGFTQKLSIGSRNFYPLFAFPFSTESHGPDLEFRDNYSTTEVIYELRYARGEYAQMTKRNKRIKLKRNREYPIYTLKYTLGSKVLGGDFDYHKISASVSKVFRLGLLGQSRMTLFLAYIPSTLPYTLLYMHQGNESPIYVQNAYNLMSYSEFVSDKYVSVHLHHDFEGLICNRIPLIKKWGWRNHLTAKVLWGTMCRGNQKLLAEQNMQVVDGANLSFLNPSTPYAEVGYGFDNIFKCLRIDFIHRLTYLNQAEATNFGVKASLFIRL